MTEMGSKLGGLELGLIFGKRKDEDLSEIKDATGKKLSRREILKAGAAGATLLGLGVGLTEDGNAGGGYYSEFIEPGRTTGKGNHGPTMHISENIPTLIPNLILNPIKQKIDGIPPGISLAGKLYERAWLIRDNSTELVKFVKEFDYQNEPASYLLASYLYENPWEFATEKRFGNLPENNPMTLFAIEIGQYVNRYLRGKNISSEKIIDVAHQTITLTSNQTINDLIKFGIKDIEKISPRDLKILIWATTWLINHLDRTEEFSYKPYYTNIEMPIRNKNSKLKIRGAPYYYDKGYT